MNKVELLREANEVELDLAAFRRAYRAIHDRLEERRSSDQTHFAEWPGTVASLNVLIMCMTRCEGLLEDFRSNLGQLPHGLTTVEDQHDS